MIALAIKLLLLVVAAAVAAVAIAVVNHRPSVGLCAVLLTIAFVPVWITLLPINTYVAPATIVCYVVLVGLLPRSSGRLVSGDLLVLAAFLLITLGVLVGTPRLYVVQTLWLEAFPAYCVGRVAAELVGGRTISRMVAGIWAVIAVLALAEWVTGTNLFTYLHASNSLYSQWAVIQERAGRPRVEGAFGHSIALGVALAAGVPFVAAAPWRPRRRLAVMLLLVLATVPTLSRTGMLCAVLAVIVSLLLLRTDLGASARVLGVGALALAAVAVLPRLLSVFAEAGTEQADSADYRGNLLVLVSRLLPLGSSPIAVSNGSTLTWGGFESIDNEVLASALRSGWVPVALMLVGLAVLVGRVLLGRGGPAQIALVCLIPAFVTVAFITQLGTLVWLLAGLAVGDGVRASPPDAHTAAASVADRDAQVDRRVGRTVA